MTPLILRPAGSTIALVSWKTTKYLIYLGGGEINPVTFEQVGYKHSLGSQYF